MGKIIKEIPHKKEQSQDVFLEIFYQILKDKIIPMLYILFQITENKGKLPNSIHDAKPSKEYKNEKYGPISLKNANTKKKSR